jgi:hypothetical protein
MAVKNPDPLMGAKLKSEIYYLIRFLIFLPVFCAVGFKALESNNMSFKKSFVLSKKVQKTQNFILVLSPLKKFIKMHKKVISKQIDEHEQK